MRNRYKSPTDYTTLLGCNGSGYVPYNAKNSNASIDELRSSLRDAKMGGFHEQAYAIYEELIHRASVKSKEFKIEKDKPIDYAKDCKLWVIGTKRVKVRSITLPPLILTYIITNDTKLSNTLKIITNDSTPIIPDESLELDVVMTHYSDDDTPLKTIIIRGCECVGECVEVNDYGTTTYQHTFKFSDWVEDRKDIIITEQQLNMYKQMNNIS